MTDEIAIEEGPEFYAWLDGELAPEAAARMEAKVAADPALAALAAQHRRLGARLHAAFDPIVAAPVPERIARAGRGAEVIDFATARERRFGRPSRAIQGAAMAASLAIGLVVGGQLRAPAGPVASEGGKLVASAALGNALDVQLASAPADAGARIGLTFRDRSGHVCRSFSDGGASGLACRDAGRWQIRGLFQGAERQGGHYRMAAGPDPQLMALIDQAIAGEPFDKASEQAALKAGWK